MIYYVYAFVNNPFKDTAEYRQVFKTRDYTEIHSFMSSNWVGFSYQIVKNVDGKRVIIKYHFE